LIKPYEKIYLDVKTKKENKQKSFNALEKELQTKRLEYKDIEKTYQIEKNKEAEREKLNHQIIEGEKWLPKLKYASQLKKEVKEHKERLNKYKANLEKERNNYQTCKADISALKTQIKEKE